MNSDDANASDDVAADNPGDRGGVAWRDRADACAVNSTAVADDHPENAAVGSLDVR
jgi:hypothetical protein